MNWKQIAGSWVLIPQRPYGIIHFLGGAFVATAPQVTYRLLLEYLAENGFAVIATPFVNTLDHSAIAQQVLLNFERVLVRLEERESAFSGYLPVYGLGHSMGCKLHLLIGCGNGVKRAGNILVSFNNYGARDAIPLVEQFNTAFDVEFTPSPTETYKQVKENYKIRRNLLIKFSNDTLDQSTALTQLLQNRYGEMVTTQTLRGNHLTPLGQDVKWQPGKEFNALDAFGQWFKQEVYRDLDRLKRSLILWLNPTTRL